MSFRCDQCKVAYPNDNAPDQKLPTRVTTKARPRTYRLPWGDFFGWEIAAEACLCTSCLTTFTPVTVTLGSDNATVTYEG